MTPREKAAKWPQNAKTQKVGETAWWYGDRDGITVVCEKREGEQFVSVMSARITRKQIADYMREVRGRRR